MTTRGIGLALLALSLTSACREKEVEVYTVAKESAAPAPAASPAPPSAGGSAMEGSGLRWTVPQGWRETPGSGMRFATFLVPSGGAKPLELAVTVLEGDAGGDLANVNRWRGQLGLEPIDEKALAAQERIKSVAGTLLQVDFIGAGPPDKKRMLAAILPHKEKTWFFKATGSEAEIAKLKPSCRLFLESLH